MNTVEILKDRRQTLKASISEVEQEIHEIDLALNAIASAGKPQVTAVVSGFKMPEQPFQHPMKVDDAIIMAVEAGCKTPVQILKHLHDKLNVKTTIGSVRARVSPLGKSGKISRDENGWKPATFNADLLDSRHAN